MQLKTIFLILLFQISWALSKAQEIDKNNTKQTTICNPINLSYRFCLDEPSRREAADPTMVLFKNEYYLFASKSGGYYHSTDLIHWHLITSNDLPLEDYAPTVMVRNDTLYYMASSNIQAIYKTSDPKSGIWTRFNVTFPVGLWDPYLFLDENAAVYLFYGCSNINPIYGVELNQNTFNPIDKPAELINSQRKVFGWERKGDYNELGENPWIEGAWVTKYDNKYYLQYAGPGTEFKSYSDGLYVSDKPLGPYKPAANNPCSSKPEGFIAGAGHSSTFQDIYGNYWHISTMTISQKHMFERRLGLFPTFFDKEGEMFVYTAFGDFPCKIPTKKITDPVELFPQWMLLSYKKPLEVSSEQPSHPKDFAVNEDIRTFWSAKTGNKGEWLSIDLLKECTINAIQINYAENETKILGRDTGTYHQYLLEYSNDGKTWHTLVDKTQNRTDIPHDYIELSTPVKCRYFKIINYHVPDGTFALAGLRIFGNGGGKAPSVTERFSVERSETDRCITKLSWQKNKNTLGYNIRYGTRKDKLYQNYQVFDLDSITIRNLNSNQKYYFTIDGFNENGITKGTRIIEVN